VLSPDSDVVLRGLGSPAGWLERSQHRPGNGLCPGPAGSQSQLPSETWLLCFVA